MIILGSEIKLYRNISGYNFPPKISYDAASDVISKLEIPLKDKGYNKYVVEELNSLEKLDLFESGKLSSSVLANEKISAIFLLDDKPTILANAENHITILKSSADLNIKVLYEQISEVDDLLDENLKYAYNENFGYLTSNPQKCGTAMSIESSLHLPATDYFGMSSILSSLKRLGYKVSLQGSDSGRSVGAIYKISPERTIGESEEVYIENFEKILAEIKTMEEQNRKKLYLENIVELEDLVKRAYGTLRHCRIIDEEEMINKMSDLFLGIELDIIKPKIDIELMQMVNQFKNGHLQIERGSLLDRKSRNILRANNIRKMMKEVF